MDVSIFFFEMAPSQPRQTRLIGFMMPRDRSDVVDIDFLLLIVAIAVFVELDIVFEAFVAVAVSEHVSNGSRKGMAGGDLI